MLAATSRGSTDGKNCSMVLKSSGASQEELFEKCITKQQLASYLNMSIGFINKMMNEGMPYKKFGRAVRFWLQDVVKWFHRKEVKP